MTESASPQVHEFKAEIKQLLDILIHSIYTSKEVFIRELISNAADALEKVRFHQASGQPLDDADAALEIHLTTHPEEGRLVIRDTGVGMTASELEANIGTIAHSGATAFLEQLRAQQENAASTTDDVSLIGRFGVGFYSVFMAAQQVTLTTRSATPGSTAMVWTSDGAGSYTMQPADESPPRGTTIDITLREEEKAFADEAQLKQIVQRYSNFVPFAIFLNGEQVNQTKALWREPARQIGDEEYSEFYQLISHDNQEPLLRLHHSLDGAMQLSALLFVPQESPEAMGFGEGEVSLQLYVQRVLIDGANDDCLPPYLRFVRGVVESQDLPLNVSRETLQQNRMVRQIRDILTRKLLDEFLKLAKDDPEKYKRFWQTYQRILKEGYSDFTHREKVQELLRFATSSQPEDEIIGLADYLDRMPAEQAAIYYLSGPSREALEQDPRLELFRKRGIEVLYLYDAADEFVLSTFGSYQDKPLVSAEQAKPDDLTGAESDDSEKAEDAAATAGVEPLIGRCKEILGDRVVDVRVSERLVDSPACLVGDDNQLSGHMEKMMRLMNKSDDLPQRVLELNADHGLIQSLVARVKADAEDPFVSLACEQLFEGCMLLDGYLTDPHRLVARMNDVLTTAASGTGSPSAD